jgi:cobalt-zinc-cadmium efflux system outer membrane protein
MHPKYFLAGACVLLAHALAAAAPMTAQPAPPGDTRQTTQTMGAASAPLTLEQAVAKALAANPGLRAAALDVAIADGLRRQAGLLPNPEISYVREGSQPGFRTQTVQVNQLIELGGKRAARVRLADGERSLAAGKLRVARSDLRADVTTAFFDALGAQERVRLAQTSLEVAEKAATAAAKRVSAGRVSPVEQDRADVARAAARVELAQAESDLSIAQHVLAAWWGETTPAAGALAMPELDLASPPPLFELEQRLDASPQMRRARLQVEREEAQVSLDRSQRMPDLTLIVGNKKDDSIGRSQTVLGVSVPLPLFNRNQGTLQASLVRADKARAELDAERVRLHQGLATAYQRAQLSREQVRNMRDDILPAAQRVFDSAVTGFEAGKFGFLDVIDAQRTLLQIRSQYIEALYDRYRAVAELSRYVDADAGADASTQAPYRIAP